MAKFTVESGIEYYRIIGPNGAEGPRVPWEATATLKYNGDLYYCDGDPDADEQVIEKVVTTDTTGFECVTDDVQYDDEEDDDDGVIPIDDPGDDDEDDDDDDPDGGEEAVA